jgi:O-acetyl-ADP-ribose deacetylase
MDVEIIQGNIAGVEADVIVNAANRALLGGGGVDGVIHAAAGPGLLDECIGLRKSKYVSGLPTGQVAVTSAHNLKAKHIFHTVGPIKGKDDLSLLKDCYVNCLKKAEELGAGSIAFPAISTGAYKVPVEYSARIIREILKEFSPNIRVILVLHSYADKSIYDEVFDEK